MATVACADGSTDAVMMDVSSVFVFRLIPAITTPLSIGPIFQVGTGNRSISDTAVLTAPLSLAEQHETIDHQKTERQPVSLMPAPHGSCAVMVCLSPTHFVPVFATT